MKIKDISFGMELCYCPDLSNPKLRVPAEVGVVEYSIPAVNIVCGRDQMRVKPENLSDCILTGLDNCKRSKCIFQDW